MKLILDGTELPFDGIYEHITEGFLNAGKQFSAEEEMPDVSGLIGKKTVTTVVCKDENNNTVPLLNTYTKISDFTVRYGTNKSYDLMLGN